jgi:hypothetical protein
VILSTSLDQRSFMTLLPWGILCARAQHDCLRQARQTEFSVRGHTLSFSFLNHVRPDFESGLTSEADLSVVADAC